MTLKKPERRQNGTTIAEWLNGLNGGTRFAAIVGVPGTIACYLVWWLTQWLGAKIERMIALLEAIARALNASVW